MRRDAVLLVVLGLALSFTSCTREECEECAECPESVDCVVDPELEGDIVSGCDTKGSPVVKALITLEKRDHKCYASVEPEEICPVQHGAIRWKIDNGCGPMDEDDEKGAAIKITKLDYVVDGETRDATWLFDVCDASLKSLGSGAPPKKNLLFCDVPLEAALGRYKYHLGGRIEPLDPWIEVRPPR